MEKLDFSGISTEELKYAVKQSSGVGCAQIKCENCPFNVNAICNNGSYEGRNKAFKAELNRREKDMNKMPELKAGMIVKGGSNLFLVITDEWLMNLDYDEDWTNPKQLSDGWVTEIYECTHYSKTYTTCANNKKLIWSKKSDKDIQIEELEKTVKEALKQIEELKA